MVRPVSPRSRLVPFAPYVFILLWSSSFVTARIGLTLVTPLLFVAVRLVIAAVILFAVMAIRGESWAPLRGRWYHLAIAGALVNGLTLAPFHVGMVTVDAAVMALVQAMSPLLIALLGGPLLGERLRGRQWLGIFLGLIGVLLVVGPYAAHGHTELTAILLGCFGVLGLAGGTLYFGRWGRGVPLLPATAVQLGSAAVLVVLAMLLIETPSCDLDGRGRGVGGVERHRRVDRQHGALLLHAEPRRGGTRGGKLLPGAGRRGTPRLVAAGREAHAPRSRWPRARLDGGVARSVTVRVAGEDGLRETGGTLTSSCPGF